MELQHPGVHVQEVRAVAPRITLAPTGVTGFVGSFPTGPAGRPTTVQSAAEFTQLFDVVGVATDTSIAVHDYFANGGSTAVIVATGGPSDTSSVDDLVRALSLLEPLPGHAPPIQLLCIPAMARRANSPFSHKDYKELVLRATSFCVQHRIFLIVDPNVAGDEIADIEHWLHMNPSWGSPNSALYFPRVHTPAGRMASGQPVASSGAVAGVVARTDNQRGVWKAPAGREASIDAVVATVVSDREQSPLNQHGVNMIRHFEDVGTVIWGARTGVGSIGNDFRFVPVRRTALFLEHSLIAGLQWSVFEPNNATLWARVTNSVSGFLGDLWHQGAFVGARQADSFFVRCDTTTMTRVDLRRGRTIVHLGFAPLRPAEFVVLKIVLERP